jgi:selenocysteine-specific elongation factor
VNDRHIVLGTAGHIDHGKSALVQSLTGTDPDRLEEEKRRGITIDLGFADVEIAPGRVLSFVDVPGHERFVRHMVAGATGIDAVLLVVAADQGVQPQTREHLDICSLLGLRRGVVALTKCDLVDQELREVAALELRETLAGGFLAEAPLVPVSARTGEGLETLREELLGLFDGVAPRPASGVTRLPVDRSFVLHGFGTVVTGTLVAGTLSEGLEAEILPGGRRGRVRGLQVHHRPVRQAVAGQRTAVNLQGLDCEDVPRGSTVTVPGALSTTRRLWASVRLLPTAPEALRRGGPVRFHQGTCERAARIRVLGEGEDGLLRAEIYLDRDSVLIPGDRFILRRPAPVDTVGGGTVVDANPPRPKPGSALAFDPSSLEIENAVRLRLVRARASGKEPAALARELGTSLEDLLAHAEGLEASETLVQAAGRWIDGEVWRRVEEQTLRNLERFHAAEPVRTGLSREELRVRTERGLPREAWRLLLERLAAGGQLSLRGESVALAGHEVRLSAGEREMVDRIEAAYRGGGLEPPELERVVEPAELAGATKLVDLLLAQGRLVRIQDGKLFHAEALEELVARLLRRAGQSTRLSVPDFKELAGVTRKHAIPLLEYLDAQRVTRRLGNDREILLQPGEDVS